MEKLQKTKEDTESDNILFSMTIQKVVAKIREKIEEIELKKIEVECKLNDGDFLLLVNGTFDKWFLGGKFNALRSLQLWIEEELRKETQIDY